MLTVVRVVHIDDIFPTVVFDSVDNGQMIIGSHAHGEIRAARRRHRHLYEDIYIKIFRGRTREKIAFEYIYGIGNVCCVM